MHVHAIRTRSVDQVVLSFFLFYSVIVCSFEVGCNCCCLLSIVCCLDAGRNVSVYFIMFKSWP